jgi:hypothetical protein
MIQPNRWSCVPTSLQMLLEIPFQVILAEIGHDGSEIKHPEHQEPFCRRGFVLQEMQDVCFKRGLCLCEIQGLPDYYDPETCDARIMNYMFGYKGLLTGYFAIDRPHCVYWNGTEIIDPMDGLTKPLDGFTIESFYLLTESNQK